LAPAMTTFVKPGQFTAFARVAVADLVCDREVWLRG
jgi:hypothetical protein